MWVIESTPIPALKFQSPAGANGAWTLAWRATAGLGYQVQYKTNLLQANWINLGTPLIATNGTLTLSDSGAGTNSAQRFYRLVLLP